MEAGYGVVLIGCGYIGQSHMEDIYYRDNIRIVGTVDIRQDAAKRFAKRYAAQSWSTDYRPYLTREDVDIVIIATYARSHLQIIQDCLAAGKHVLCEKPIVPVYDEVAPLREAAAQSKAKLLIAHVLRHNASYQKIAQMIQEGAIGEPRVFRMVQNHHDIGQQRLGALLDDCPPIVDCGVHYIDVIRWFTGQEIVSVSGVGSWIGAHTDGHMDYGMITMRLSGGAVAYYEAGWAHTVAFQNLKEFIGTKGRIRLTLQSERFFDREEGDLIEYYNGETGEYRTINHPSVYKNMWGQLQCLIRMIEDGEEANPTLEDACEALRIALLGDQAIREQRTIAIEPAGQGT